MIFQNGRYIEQILKVVFLIELFDIVICKLLAEFALENIGPFQINLLPLDRRPYGKPVAILFAGGIQYPFEGFVCRYQMPVVHAFKRDTVKLDGKSQVAVFIMHNVLSNVLTDFRKKVLLRRLPLQLLP